MLHPVHARLRRSALPLGGADRRRGAVPRGRHRDAPGALRSWLFHRGRHSAHASGDVRQRPPRARARIFPHASLSRRGECPRHPSARGTPVERALFRRRRLASAGARRGGPLPGAGSSGEPGGTAPGTTRLVVALVEFSGQAFPVRVVERLVDLKRAGVRVLLAHPERYRPVWTDDACLDPLIDSGVRLLLDVCALVGKYGRAAQAAAEKLLEEDAYDAACSDAHKPQDVPEVRRAIELLESRVGAKEALRLLSEGPSAILTEG